MQSLGLDIRILTENNQEISIGEITQDDISPLTKDVEEELKEITLEFDEPETKDEVLEEIEKDTTAFDASNLFDDMSDDE